MKEKQYIRFIELSGISITRGVTEEIMKEMFLSE
jgi:hypothetical protein